MREKDLQSLFTKYHKEIIDKLESLLWHERLESFAFELKIAKGKSLPFDHVEEHQIKALSDVQNNKGVYHKISDHARGMGTQSPFDCLFIRGYSFIVVGWYVPRQRKEFHFIGIQDWITEVESSKRKSLTYARSLEICELNFNLKKK